jgi:hypothetical protein
MSTGGGFTSPELSLLTNISNLIGRECGAQVSCFMRRGGALISPEVTLQTNTNEKNRGKVIKDLILCDMIETPFSKLLLTFFLFHDDLT